MRGAKRLAATVTSSAPRGLVAQKGPTRPPINSMQILRVANLLGHIRVTTANKNTDYGHDGAKLDVGGT